MRLGWLSVVCFAMACTGGTATPPQQAPEPEAASPAPSEPAPKPTEVAKTTLPAMPKAEAGSGERPEDCTLDPKGLEARWAPMQGEAKVEVLKDGDGIVESVHLPDGTHARSIYGGCYHVNMTEEFALTAPPADALAKAKELMGQIARPAGEPDSLVRGIQGAKALGEGGDIPCGEFNTCWVRVEGKVLEAGFSFSM